MIFAMIFRISLGVKILGWSSRDWNTPEVLRPWDSTDLRDCHGRVWGPFPDFGFGISRGGGASLKNQGMSHTISWKNGMFEFESKKNVCSFKLAGCFLLLNWYFKKKTWNRNISVIWQSKWKKTPRVRTCHQMDWGGVLESWIEKMLVESDMKDASCPLPLIPGWHWSQTKKPSFKLQLLPPIHGCFLEHPKALVLS